MPELAPWRVNLLRVAYAVLVLGLGSVIWPGVINPATHWTLQGGTVTAMLAALSLLAVLGLRQPLRMLPLLLWEVAWKAVWLLRMLWPQWSAGTMDAATTGQMWECLPIIPFCLLIPWDYVWTVYIAGPAAPWRTART